MIPANPSTDFLTVATVSYASQALATLRSARQYGHYSQLHFFALDAAPGATATLRHALGEDAAWIQVFGPHDLDDEDKTVFLRTFQYYNPIEISCLAKYVGAAHVLRHSASADRCIYADADILFMADTDEAVEELHDKTILLTPHQFGPSSDSAEHDYLLHGWINAGFFVVNRDSPTTGEMLAWLINRISRRGFLAPGLGLSCDQTWVSLLPAMFEEHTAICHHPGYNVAYWNLTERGLKEGDGGLLADGRRLVFFHFSGFTGAGCLQLSKHSSYPVPPGSLLEGICRRYQATLDAAMSLPLSDIATLPCSRAGLRERISIGSHLNQLNIDAPTMKRGFFSRLGLKLDIMLLRSARKMDR